METIRKTMGEMIGRVAREYPQKEALVHTEIGVRYSYALLDWEVSRVSGGLISLGIERGDRVAVWAPNIPEFIIAQLAVCKMGAVMVPIDPGVGSGDLHFILNESECRALIMARGAEPEDPMDEVLYERERIPSLENVVTVSDRLDPEVVTWTDLTDMGEGEPMGRLGEFEAAVRPEDPAAIMYTSGTTGKPKGVVLDHVGLINKTLCSIARQGLMPSDRLALFFPLFHMFGNTCITLAGLLTGASLVMPCRTFDPARVLEALYKEKCTAVYGSPSMLIALLDHPEFLDKRWGSVTKGTIGGAPCPMELMRRLVEELHVSDITVAYGITEASSWVTMTKPDDPLERRVATMGTPLECSEVKIVDPMGGETLSPGRQGEICTKGFLMKGYHKMPAATADAVDREGWFHTGDLGEMDAEGYLTITGRLKDVIIREGVEIYPVELEEVLYGLPEISEVQVFGFSHPEKGQEVAAWMKVKQGSQLTLEAVEGYIRQNVKKEKAPHYLKFVREFPMTRSGKVKKFKLAEMAAKEYGKSG